MVRCMYYALHFSSIGPSFCADAGYTGCCEDIGGCFLSSGMCYCDQVCHDNNDCCPDIIQVGCFRKCFLLVPYMYVNFALFIAAEGGGIPKRLHVNYLCYNIIFNTVCNRVIHTSV